jgi:FMN-binding domain
MRLTLLPAACIALSPASAWAVDYLSAEQAQRLMFPEADSFVPHDIALTAAQLQQLDASGIKGRSAHWKMIEARRGNALLGRVVFDEVIGKVELISYAVAIGSDGAVQQVEILSYRESHGQEVRLPAWRKQFVGKTAASPLHLGDDIANISGATLSCTHITDGVRRVVAVVDIATRTSASS